MKAHQPGYGDFGNLSKYYNEGRPAFPKEVMDYFWSSLNKTSAAKLLDIGCGTGAPTRQLLIDGIKLFAIDKSPEMIKIAREIGPSDINYHVGLVNSLPFADNEFDAITSFASFHWFTDNKSINQIKRVLKNHGTFFVSNKNDSGNSQKLSYMVFEEVLKDFIPDNVLPDAKQDYDPKEILVQNGFVEIKQKKIITSEYFTFSQAINYIQSVSKWNLIPDANKQEALKQIEAFCKTLLIDNLIESKIEVVSVTGKIT